MYALELLNIFDRREKGKNIGLWTTDTILIQARSQDFLPGVGGFAIRKKWTSAVCGGCDGCVLDPIF